jgi:hypothetical protein
MPVVGWLGKWRTFLTCRLALLLIYLFFRGRRTGLLLKHSEYSFCVVFDGIGVADIFFRNERLPVLAVMFDDFVEIFVDLLLQLALIVNVFVADAFHWFWQFLFLQKPSYNCCRCQRC